MFKIQCPRHGSQVLVSERRIRKFGNTNHGIMLDVECWCGQHVVIQTGKRAGRDLVPA